MDIQNIHCLAILDKSGNTIIKKTHIETDIQKIYNTIKTEREDITIVDDRLVVYKNLDETIIFIASSIDTNELYLQKALEGFFNALVEIVKTHPSNESIMSYYDRVIMLIDAFVYQGVVLENNSENLVAAVAVRPFESLEGMKIPKSFTTVFNKAAQKFKK